MGYLISRPRVQAFGEFGYSNNQTEQTFTKPFFANTTGLQPTPAGLQPFTYNIIYGPGVAGNPFGTNATFAGNLQGLGTRDAEIESDTWRVLGGVRYGLARGTSRAPRLGRRTKLKATSPIGCRRAVVSSTFGVPTTPQPPTPLSSSSLYNLDVPLSNSPPAGFLINVGRTAESELKLIDTKGTTEFGSLPGGPIGVALGIEYKEEELRDTPILRRSTATFWAKAIRRLTRAGIALRLMSNSRCL